MRQDTKEKLIIYSNSDIKSQIAYEIAMNVPIFTDLGSILEDADGAFENTKKEIKKNKNYIKQNIFLSKDKRRLSNPNDETEYSDIFPKLELNINSNAGKILVSLSIFYKSKEEHVAGDDAASNPGEIVLHIWAKDYDDLLDSFDARYPLFVHEYIHVHFYNSPHLSKKVLSKLEKILRIDKERFFFAGLSEKEYYSGVEETINQFVDMIIVEGFDYIDKPVVKMIPEIYRRYKRTKGYRPNYIQTVALAIMLSKYKRKIKKIIKKYKDLEPKKRHSYFD